MKWSISSYREFLRCQRKWFLKEKVASRSNKDSFRKEIYLLSQLESIDAWRGKIVDYTISEFIIPELKKKTDVLLNNVIAFARNIAEKRYKFAKAEKYKDISFKKSEHIHDFAALYPFEYKNTTINLDDKFKQAWNEIEIALHNFLSNHILINYLISANYLIKQRMLSYSLHDYTVRGVPDLIVFNQKQAPHIFDWKVHYFGTKNYSVQLINYALALKRCKPHVDFPNTLNDYSIYDIKLSEYQLLKNVIREYTITDDQIEDINDYIADGIYKMKLYKCENKYEHLNIIDFEKTPNLDNCKSCSFKKICKEDDK